MKYLLLSVALLYSCNTPPVPPKSLQSEPVALVPQPIIQSPSLPHDTIPCPGEPLDKQTDTIPLNLYSPKIRYDVCGWSMPEDTTTLNGNFVHFLISNDSCCRDYLYLEWGNKKFKNLENLGSFRQFNPTMSPQYVGESADYLFFDGAASGGIPITGWNLWLFPLRPHGHSEVFNTIAPEAYDLKSMTIIRENESNQTDDYILEAYNIRTKRSKPIKFKDRLPKDGQFSDKLSWLMDSVSVSPQTIFLRMEIFIKNDNGSMRTIVLPNDIK